MKTWANILLGIWLVLSGLVHLGAVSFSNGGKILAVLGIAAGILIVIADRNEKLASKTGSILLGAWLVAGGLMSLFNLSFSGIGVLYAVLAVAAGIMVLVSRR